MKVLKKGREQKGWSKECICTGEGNGGGGCGAKLLVEKDDLFATYNSCLGETESYVTFRCIECSVETDIKGSPFYPQELPDKKVWQDSHGRGT